MAKEMALSNVDFRPMVQKNKVFGVMGEADAFISIIRKTPDWIGTISSNKLNDYLISGRPIIFAVGSENNPVKKAKAGIVVPPENQEALAGAVMKMISLSKKERMKMGRNGREYAKKNLDIKILSKRLENLL
jgi:glycosyltransferase involved in cell wall biosynthesis